MNMPWPCFVCGDLCAECGHREPELVSWWTKESRLQPQNTWVESPRNDSEVPSARKTLPIRHSPILRDFHGNRKISTPEGISLAFQIPHRIT